MIVILNHQEITLAKKSEIIDGDLTNSNSTETTNEDTTAKTPIKANANGVIVEVEFDDSTFFVNVNGVILEFMVNGDRNYPSKQIIY